MRQDTSQNTNQGISQNTQNTQSGSRLVEERLGDVFWPGDARWPGLVDKLDFLFYADAVSVAKDVAPKIADYLRSRTGLRQSAFEEFAFDPLHREVRVRLGMNAARDVPNDVGMGQ